MRYTCACGMHEAVYLACTPCQSLNVVSLSLSGFDEAKELQFRNSLNETCTVTSQGTVHLQTDGTDTQPGPKSQPLTPSAYCKQCERLDTRLATYTELLTWFAISFVPMVSPCLRGEHGNEASLTTDECKEDTVALGQFPALISYCLSL